MNTYYDGKNVGDIPWFELLQKWRVFHAVLDSILSMSDYLTDRTAWYLDNPKQEQTPKSRVG